MRAAVYGRVSTTRQAQAQTIEQQLDRLRAAVAGHGWELHEQHVYRDDGYSGASLGRPGLDRLRDHAALAELDAVLVTAPDRLARNYVHQVLLIDELAGHGCQVEFLDRPMSQDPHDQLLLQIRGAVAGYGRAPSGAPRLTPAGRGPAPPGWCGPAAVSRRCSRSGRAKATPRGLSRTGSRCRSRRLGGRRPSPGCRPSGTPTSGPPCATPATSTCCARWPAAVCAGCRAWSARLGPATATTCAAGVPTRCGWPRGSAATPATFPLTRWTSWSGPTCVRC